MAARRLRQPGGPLPAFALLLPHVPNGVPLERFGAHLRKRNFVLAMGRICPEKGYHLALDAATRAGVPLVLAGEVFRYRAHEEYFAARSPRGSPAAATASSGPWVWPENAACWRPHAACWCPAWRRRPVPWWRWRRWRAALPLSRSRRGAARDRRPRPHRFPGERRRGNGRGHPGGVFHRPGRVPARRAGTVLRGPHAGALSRSVRPPGRPTCGDRPPCLRSKNCPIPPASKPWQASGPGCGSAAPRPRPSSIRMAAAVVAQPVGRGRALLDRAARRRAPGRTGAALHLGTRPPLGLAGGRGHHGLSGLPDRTAPRRPRHGTRPGPPGPPSRPLDACDFQELPPASPIPAAAAALPHVRCEPCSTCPVLPLPAAWQEFEASLPRPWRTSVRRARNRVRTAGGEPLLSDDVTAVLPELFLLHEKRWRERGGEGVVNTAALRRFYLEAAQGLLRAGMLRLWTLPLDGRPAAVLFGFAGHGRFYAYLDGFDPAQAKLSPGTVLLSYAGSRHSWDGCVSSISCARRSRSNTSGAPGTRARAACGSTHDRLPRTEAPRAGGRRAAGRSRACCR